MFSMADQTLLQPFLAKPTNKGSTSESDSGILLRLFSVVLVGAISLWANHEASKGFSITIINDVEGSPSGKRFALFFESDDTAVRILLDTSLFVEKFLYEGVSHRLQKPVNHVTVRFCGNSSDGVERFSVTSGASHGEYVIRLSSSLMERSKFSNTLESALRQSMVRIWLWGDKSGASPELVASMVEYLVVEARKRRHLDKLGGHWKDKSVSVVSFLDYCERRSEGFIRRLNNGMRLRWDDRTVDLASRGACDSRKDVLRELKMDDSGLIIERKNMIGSLVLSYCSTHGSTSLFNVYNLTSLFFSENDLFFFFSLVLYKIKEINEISMFGLDKYSRKILLEPNFGEWKTFDFVISNRPRPCPTKVAGVGSGPRDLFTYCSIYLFKCQRHTNQGLI